MARHHFRDADPIGHRVTFDRGAHWTTVVGLVDDVKQYGLDSAPTDESTSRSRRTGRSAPPSWCGRRATRSRSRPACARSCAGSIRSSRSATSRRSRRRARARWRRRELTALLVALFALIALVITAAGIAGVVSFAVSQRTAEIGVRMALGAPRGAVVGMIVRQGLTPVALGLAAGVVGALPLARLVGRLLFAVEPTDPPTYAAVILVLAAVAAAACFAPARRAAAIDPMLALRAD